jgi:hypothetical protein
MVALIELAKGFIIISHHKSSAISSSACYTDFHVGSDDNRDLFGAGQRRRGTDAVEMKKITSPAPGID